MPPHKIQPRRRSTEPGCARKRKIVARTVGRLRLLSCRHSNLTLRRNRVSSNWAGVVKAYLMAENQEEVERARAALADLFAEAGDEETSQLIREEGLPVYFVSNDGSHLHDEVQSLDGSRGPSWQG